MSNSSRLSCGGSATSIKAYSGAVKFVQIAEAKLWRFRIPFRQAFSHAAARRDSSDVILIRLRSEHGQVGYGEIQARRYVTGESNEEIWASRGRDVAAELVGQTIQSFDNIAELLGGEEAYASEPACIGGFDMALTDLLDHEGVGGVDWTAVFGPQRTRPVTKCLTIGDDQDEEQLIRQARFARLSRCGVIKIKVNGPDDARRVEVLRASVGEGMAIRLDGNGMLDPRGAELLLKSLIGLGVDSIEEPLACDRPHLVAELTALYAETGVPIVADESICTVRDLQRFAGTGAYQTVNVRVGKSGGVTGAAGLLRQSLDCGFDVVSGTMVGETAVMLRFSKKMLHHCDALSYVEGLDQSKVLLAEEVIWPADHDAEHHFSWNVAAYRRYLVGEKVVRRNVLMSRRSRRYVEQD
jgi:L-alanine-DL-glutamate epimerase-like enolase superfamily enzyme